jgi:hypothetical protein
VLDPIPDLSQGVIKVTYERALDRLALRSAQVNGAPSGTTIDLTHAAFGAPSAADEALLVANQYVCIHDYYGTPMLYNGVIASYNAPTDAITLAADVDTYLVNGYTLADLENGYLTIGKYTTTHSKLPNEAEPYFVEWVNRKLHAVESSTQFDDTDEILRELRNNVVAAFRMPDKARKSMPVSNWDILIPGYE